MSTDNLLTRALALERKALAQCMSRIERGELALTESREIFSKSGRAQVIAVTGPPGAGKSTLTDGLVKHIRAKGKTVAVVAVDPSSPYTGGAVLGDRVRRFEGQVDDGVFFRSVATRGHPGGIAQATQNMVRLLDAAGFEVILVETVGIGQSEIKVDRMAGTTLLVMVPESGDVMQAMKSGILETADVIAVNKSDRPGAEDLLQNLTETFSGQIHHKDPQWNVPVLATTAKQEEGLDTLWAALHDHHTHKAQSPRAQEQQRENLKAEMLDLLAEDFLLEKLKEETFQRNLEAGLDDLTQGKLSPAELIAKLR